MAKPTSRPAQTPLPVASPAAGPATCGECRHWVALPGGRFGECRRHPPAFVLAAGTFGPKVGYGQTSPDLGACGDGELRS